MSQETLSVFRKDKKNVGDWFSTPNKFLPFRTLNERDLIAHHGIPEETKLIILGGGGLGRPDFAPFLERLCKPGRNYKVIGWGIGGDSSVDKKLVEPEKYDPQNILQYFSGLNEIGSRIYGQNLAHNYTWVPCASCLSPLFNSLKEAESNYDIGIYEHLRFPIRLLAEDRACIKKLRVGGLSNRGLNLKAKLEFLASCKYVITNSYHGVYWATLLNKKVICVPIKDGLYSFKHRPSYHRSKGSLEGCLAEASAYPNALKECRKANLNFYSQLISKYGDI